VTEKVQIPEVLLDRLGPLATYRFIRVDGKRPIDGGWQTNPRPADDPELQTWLNGGGNYGVVGGFGLVIVDVDSDELKQVARERLPETFTVQSPGSLGSHLYYIGSLEKAIRLRDKGGKNLGDIQGPGKQVVGPASVHPNGKVYEIVSDRPLAQVTREQILAAFEPYVVPEQELEQAEAAAREEKREHSDIDVSMSQVVNLSTLHRRGDEYWGAHPVHGSEGGHNFWVNEAKNCWHCFRHSTGGGPLQWLAVELGIISCEEALPGALRGERFKRIIEAGRKRGLITEAGLEARTREHSGQTVNDPRRFFEDGTFQPAFLADFIMGSHHFRTLRDTSEIYVYDAGCYRPKGEKVIDELVKRLLGDEYRENRAREVIANIRSSTYADRVEEPPNLIPLKNGVYDLDTDQLLEHSPDRFFLSVIPVVYDPAARCPEIESFLKTVTDSEGDMVLLQEWTGYCLYRRYVIHKMLFLLGVGENGKTTFLSLLDAFLGRSNVSHVSLQQLVEDRFAMSELYGKLANTNADLPKKALFETGMVKMITGADRLMAQRKFRDLFQFENYAKLAFACNGLPMAYDDSDAFHRRTLIVNFNKRFTDMPVGPGQIKRIPNYIDRLTTEQEMSGFLNLALKSLKQLLERSYFLDAGDRPKRVEEAREEYKRRSEPVYAFRHDALLPDPEGKVDKEALYQAFLDYCRGRKLLPLTKNAFYRQLQHHVEFKEQRKFEILKDGRQVLTQRLIVGVHLLDDPCSGSAQTLLTGLTGLTGTPSI